ncbi:MAG: Gfo/Idh/MocA family oxidoreductase [Candidatus Eremiobacteraeota bacterium]|nr:Gfo/Idh/MocA family oxidoreductase [Candidatus Eremiobacteraeota bacterium]
MRNPRVRFAIIGAGAIAQAYAKAFAQCPLAQVVAVADVRLDAARRLAAELGAQPFASHSTLLRGKDFDAALVCTTPVSHTEIAVALLGAGKHVLCEKPLAVDIGSAKRMLQAARDSRTILTMGSKFRYVEDVIQTKHFIETGLIGQVMAVENGFTSRVDMSKSWHAMPALSGGGVIIDNGTHSVDIVRYLCGPIATIAASEAMRVQRLEVEDTAHLVARTDSNVLASIDLSWSLNRQSESYIRICGAEGTVSLDWMGSKYCSSNGGRWVRFGRGYNKIDAFAAQLLNFCRATVQQEALLISADDALASVETITAAYKSLRSHRWVTVRADETYRPLSGFVAAAGA